MAQILLLGFVALVLAVCVLLIYLMSRVLWAAWQRNQALVRHGVDTEAEVIDRERTTGREGAPICYITYRYIVPTAEGEHQFTAKEQVWFTHFDNYPIGTKVWVRYLPSNPKVVLRSEKLVGRG